MGWQSQAICILEHVNVNEFIPSLADEADPKRTRALHAHAKTYCGRCPVTAECLEWAFSCEERVGVWGNTTPRERRAIKEHRAHELDHLAR